MAITSIDMPSNPCQAREAIKVVVNSDETDPTYSIRLRVELEDSPLSDTWTIKTELNAPILDGAATFYLQDLFREELLNLTDPDDGGSVGNDLNVCRKFRVEAWEYSPAGFELLAEDYHEGSGYDEVLLDSSIAPGTQVLVILETTDPDSVSSANLRNSSSTSEGLAVQKTYPDEVWLFEASTDNTNDRMYLPGYVKASIYETSISTVGTVSAERYAILAGGLNYLSV